MSCNPPENHIIKEARQEMTVIGYLDLKTAAEVEAALAKTGTTLVMINSLCCKAGNIARPAAADVIGHKHRPDHLVTVFAGQNPEATEKARTYFTGYEPSSPSFALLKDGQILTMIERFEIAESTRSEIATKLQTIFDQYCEEV